MGKPSHSFLQQPSHRIALPGNTNRLWEVQNSHKHHLHPLSWGQNLGHKHSHYRKKESDTWVKNQCWQLSWGPSSVCSKIPRELHAQISLHGHGTGTMLLSVGVKTQIVQPLWETLSQNDSCHTISFRWVALSLMGDGLQIFYVQCPFTLKKYYPG